MVLLAKVLNVEVCSSWDGWVVNHVHGVAITKGFAVAGLTSLLRLGDLPKILTLASFVLFPTMYQRFTFNARCYYANSVKTPMDLKF